MSDRQLDHRRGEPQARRRRKGTNPPAPKPVRMPRITRLMALPIKFQDMIDRGEVCDYADLARLGYVTRARMTQITEPAEPGAGHPGTNLVGRLPQRLALRALPPPDSRSPLLEGTAAAAWLKAGV